MPFAFMSAADCLVRPRAAKVGFVCTLLMTAALQFIRSLQGLGFSLHEIREFVSLRTNDLRACSAVRKMLDHKLKNIHAKRIALAKLEHELKSALTKCSMQLKHRRGNSGRCPVLTVFDTSKHNGAE